MNLHTTGHKAVIAPLTSADLVDVLALQETARALLPAEMKGFVPVQSVAYFQNMLSDITGQMIGIRCEGRLVAHISVIGPMELREAIAMRLITNNDIPFHHATLTDTIIVLANKLTHPDWRGYGFGAALLEAAMSLPLAQTSDHIFAQIPVGDRRSWDAYMRQGFGIVAAGYEPQDKHPHFILQKPAFGFDFSPAIIADEVDPSEDFSAIVNLTKREALVGVFEAPEATTLSFMRNREASTLMPTVAKLKASV